MPLPSPHKTACVFICLFVEKRPVSHLQTGLNRMFFLKVLQIQIHTLIHTLRNQPLQLVNCLDFIFLWLKNTRRNFKQEETVCHSDLSFKIDGFCVSQAKNNSLHVKLRTV